MALVALFAGCAPPEAGEHAPNCWEGADSSADARAEVIAGSFPAVAVTLTETSVCWSTVDSILCARKDGGMPSVLVSGGVTPAQLSVDGARVYWTDLETDSVSAVSLEGGEPDALVVGQEGPFGIAVANDMVTLDGTDVPAGGATTVYWTDRRAGAVQATSTDAIPPVTTTLSTSEAYPLGLAVDATAVYWADADGHAIRRAPRAGGQTVTVAETYSPEDVVVDDVFVYWTSESDGTVSRAPKGGGPPELLADGQWGAGEIGVDQDNVYWVNRLACNVMRAPKAGGPPAEVASGQAFPTGIAVDDSHVYWVNFHDGAVVRAQKR